MYRFLVRCYEGFRFINTTDEQRFQDTFVDFLAAPGDIPSYVMITSRISFADWSVGSRLHTGLLTLDSRSGEPKIDQEGGKL